MLILGIIKSKCGVRIKRTEMKSKILIIVGHPDSKSLNAHFGDKYADGARDKGYEVKILKLGDLQFDPILHKGYKVIQELEPDLKMAQEEIKWCDHLVVIYPSWWSTMPAILKGFFDRIWMPGFAFHFDHKGITHGFMWHGLLKGRTARVFVTSDSPAFFARILFGDTTNEIKKGILWFAGFKPSVTKVGGLKNASPQKIERLSKKFYSWGRSGY